MNNYKTTTPEVLQFCYKMADLIGRQWIARATAIVLIIFLGSLVFSFLSPAHGEAFAYNVTIISGILSAGFVGMLAAIGVGVSVNLGTIIIGYGVREARQISGKQMALPAGELYDISPDVLVWSRLDETETQFQHRILEAQKNRGLNYVVVIKFQDTQIRVQDNTAAGFGVNRNDPDFGFEDVEIHKFTEETESDYAHYLQTVTPKIKARMLLEKTKVSKTAFGPILGHALNTIIFLLLAAATLTAQNNTQKVYDYLGARALDIPVTDEPVTFKFEKETILRYGDGKTKTGDMIATRPAADGINHGRLISVYRAGSEVPASGKQAIPSTGTNDKPQPLFQTRMEPHNEAVPQTKSFAESMPDSSQVAAALDEAKRQLPFYKSALYKVFSPIIEFLAWLFFFLCPLFGVALGFCNLVSRSAQQNGNLGPAVADQQIRFAAAAWWIAMLLVGSAYLCITASMFFWQWHPVAIGIICLVGYIPAKWAINRLTPNGDHQQTTIVTRSNNRVGSGNSGQRFIG